MVEMRCVRLWESESKGSHRPNTARETAAVFCTRFRIAPVIEPRPDASQKDCAETIRSSVHFMLRSEVFQTLMADVARVVHGKWRNSSIQCAFHVAIRFFDHFTKHAENRENDRNIIRS